MKTIRWGIIGVGDVTEVKSGPGFQKAQHAELVAVMRRNGELAKDYAQRHGVQRWYDEADALINDADVDAVYIATPPHVHKEYTLKVAAAGKPVYVEKPMALNFADCQEMIAACAEANVPLWVAYYRRRLRKFVKVKELLDTGAIGDVHTVHREIHMPLMPVDPENLPWRFNPEIGGGGKFVDLAAHTFDILDYFLGPISEVNGIATNLGGAYPAEDNVTASFRFESGAVGSGIWSFTSSRQTDTALLSGTKGTLEFSIFNDEPIVQTTDGHTETFHLPFAEHVQQPLIQTIVDELNGHGQCPSTGESGARTTRVMDQILASYYA